MAWKFLLHNHCHHRITVDTCWRQHSHFVSHVLKCCLQFLIAGTHLSSFWALIFCKMWQLWQASLESFFGRVIFMNAFAVLLGRCVVCFTKEFRQVARSCLAQYCAVHQKCERKSILCYLFQCKPNKNSLFASSRKLVFQWLLSVGIRCKFAIFVCEIETRSVVSRFLVEVNFRILNEWMNTFSHLFCESSHMCCFLVGKNGVHNGVSTFCLQINTHVCNFCPEGADSGETENHVFSSPQFLTKMSAGNILHVTKEKKNKNKNNNNKKNGDVTLLFELTAIKEHTWLVYALLQCRHQWSGNEIFAMKAALPNVFAIGIIANVCLWNSVIDNFK